MKQKIRKLLALTLVLTVFLSSINVSVYAEELNPSAEQTVVDETITEEFSIVAPSVEDTSMEDAITEEYVAEESTIEESTTTEEASIEESATAEATNEEASTTDDANGWYGTSTQSIYESENYKITYTLDSFWDGGYNATINIENLSDSNIKNWHLIFDSANEISNIWNAQIYEYADGYYTIQNAGWNKDIAIGQSIEFGITSPSTFQGFPQTFDLLGEMKEKTVEDYSITYSLENDWESGFTASIAITNNTNTTIEDWVLAFEFERTITDVWDAAIVSHADNEYIISNAGYNCNIPIGQTVTFGLSGCNGDSTMEPQNYLLTDFSFSVSEDYVDDYSTKIDMETDTDQDGVEDFLENLYGTDPFNADTDCDGLSDYIELFSILTDPLLVDSDANGIVDGDEDYDTDGLNNLYEVSLGTNLTKTDSDYDGINDYDELNISFTSPTAYDTDEDTIADGDELILGINPLNAYSDGINPDSTRTFEQTLSISNIEEALIADNLVIPSIQGNVTNMIDRNIVLRTKNVYALDNNRAVIGKPVLVKTAYDTNADIRLYFDCSSIFAPTELLMICRYENGTFIPCTTNYNDGVIWTNVTGGIYFVINSETLLYDLDVPTDKYIEMSDVPVIATFSLNSEDETTEKVTCDDSWILLSDCQYVQLAQTFSLRPYSGDGDDIADIDEIGTAYEMDLTPYISSFLNAYSISEASYDDQVAVTAYTYSSNPTLVDTDFDGINDGVDSAPNDNNFEGTMYYTLNDEVDSHNIEFSVDYRDFFGSNTTYNNDIAVLASLYASDIYVGNYVKVTNGASGGADSATTLAKLFGLEDVENIFIKSSAYTTDKDDITDFVVGHRAVTYNGTTREIILLCVRGTNGTNEEWSSNFDVGADTSAYYNKVGSSHPYWNNKANHKGFDVTANRVLAKFEDYITRHGLGASSLNKTILVTGHSRGAAIANILGAHFEDDSEYKSFTYTFAAPFTTTQSTATSYKTIRNIMNTDDLIPYLPLEGWGFKKYGIVHKLSVEDMYENKWLTAEEGTFEWLIGSDYNNDSGTTRTVNSFLAIANNRSDLYVLDSTSDGTVNIGNKYHTTTSGANKRMAEVKSLLSAVKLLRFCNVYVKGSAIKHVAVNYCPAYLMQNLANMASSTGPLTGYDVKGKYADAKASFIASSGFIPGGLIGGMSHPHMPSTYYLMVHNKLQSL